jgi:hypothetical protein
MHHALFKDGVLTSKHLDGEVAVARAKKSQSLKHVMFIQNGGQAPQAVTFENGIAIQGETRPTLINPPPDAPEPKTPPPPAEPVDNSPISKATR